MQREMTLLEAPVSCTPGIVAFGMRQGHRLLAHHRIARSRLWVCKHRTSTALANLQYLGLGILDPSMDRCQSHYMPRMSSKTTTCQHK